MDTSVLQAKWLGDQCMKPEVMWIRALPAATRAFFVRKILRLVTCDGMRHPLGSLRVLKKLLFFHTVFWVS
jgi:hypothetical protein